ncbi:MAG: helix-turn-helix transcriptional regulator [Mobilicoccus sp.]|nr:helix-turn-helix transcriptional regulator [Mobilicoccus sp.]
MSSAFHEKLDEAIEKRGLSLNRVRHHLRRSGHDVSVATLSYWRRGLARPTRARSLAAVEALEKVLGLEPQELIASLNAPATVDGSASLATADELAATLGLTWEGGTRRMSLQETTFLDERGHPTHIRYRSSVIAERDGVDRLPAAFGLEDEAAEPEFVALAGCTLGRLVRSDTLMMTELVLPHPLRRGDGWVLEYQIDVHHPALAMTMARRYVAGSLRDLHMGLVFHPDHLPLSLEWATESTAGREVHPIVLRGPSADVHLVDFGPGVLEMTWTWGDDR